MTYRLKLGDRIISDGNGKELSGLENIDLFTMNFSCTDELMAYLLAEGQIENTDCNKDFQVVFCNGKNNRTLDFGVAYLEDKEYFRYQMNDDGSKEGLLNAYIDRMHDSDFMNSFVERYYPYLHGKHYFRDINAIKTYVEQLEQNGSYRSEDDAKDAMKSFIRCFCIKKGKKGTYSLSYPRIRELAMFIVNYNRERAEFENIEKQIQLTEAIILDIESLKILIEHLRNQLEAGVPSDSYGECQESLQAATCELNLLRQRLDARNKR